MSQLAKRNTVSLRREWRLFDRDHAKPETFLRLCERMIEVGEFLLAHDVARAGLANYSNHKALAQRAAHALCKAGSPLTATHILEELVATGVTDVETQSLLASAYKDLCENTTDNAKKQDYADLAIARYEQAYLGRKSESSGKENLDNLYYPCINIAFMHFVCMNYEKAREYATTALEMCCSILEMDEANYWVRATQGESFLLLGRIDEALDAYSLAVELPDAKPSYVASTRKQALQISSLYEDPSIRQRISSAFPTLGIVACSGHLIDNPGKSRRFPQEAELIVRAKIEEKLDFMGATCGYSSAACGTDIIFLEALAERGAETHVFLPFAKEEFIHTSVVRGGGDWVARFEKVLDNATSVHYVTNEGYYGDDGLFSFCNDVMLGFAAMRSRGLDEVPNLLLFWDGQKGKEGGTAEVARSWKETFQEPTIINSNEVLELLDQLEEPPIPKGDTKPIFVKSFGDTVTALRSVKTMLFADVEAFTRVKEELTAQFVEVFHGGVAKMMQELNCKPEFVNSWGDSFFAVFDDLNDALRLAMHMRDFFGSGNWPELSENGNLDVRISMHAGPVYEEFDPLLKKPNFFGRHVNQAARIEPIVLPGSVFVSETVAALISYRYGDFDFEYAGNLELAKDFGAYPVYILQRKGY
ncbi:MAG: adenylate/guanylate cyclase domain-containing protein [Opitutae bacterium]